ncbi:hypothetical protein PUNSTDRAFT_55626 [Punctularia strigosozonata HHB-11173 SS5]|uniref:Uncharacterized protein n=1 Tax=Punctularia strigosozonata (strain HHB-11173) TaxID=741275 RepID=R7S1T2_PUNST|nr:uncharacterized protein PUNSTDRAFT_55626 [Punctularia strigosozonata HHB-11173 SS5]EIN04360.1 hypothetical protein PUNSTDRAFT_55626 [Punctularia strigosozonata HHB-11173 SS5]
MRSTLIVAVHYAGASVFIYEKSDGTLVFYEIVRGGVQVPTSPSSSLEVRKELPVASARPVVLQAAVTGLRSVERGLKRLGSIVTGRRKMPAVVEIKVEVDVKVVEEVQEMDWDMVLGEGQATVERRKAMKKGLMGARKAMVERKGAIRRAGQVDV